MAWGFSTALNAILSAIKLPRMVLLLTIHRSTGDVLLTSWPKTITIGTNTYVGAAQYSTRFSLSGEGFGEALDFSAPSAVLRFKALSPGDFHSDFFNDLFRGVRVTVGVAYYDGSSFQATPWQVTMMSDADESDDAAITLRQASVDAAQGDEIPRRTTQEEGCQWEYKRGRCTYRGSIPDCDHTFWGPNGCRVHFQRITDPDDSSIVYVQPKPYGAFLGGIDHNMVTRS